ncbi:MAG: twin-arginine translocase subunit TatC [Pseudomonadota bacterium]
MNTPKDLEDEPQTLLFHLMELRAMLMRSVIVVVVLFAMLMPFGKRLFELASAPLAEKLPTNATMIATNVISPFLTPFKLSFFTALFLAMPYILYQVWGFVAPGLYKNEKKAAIPLLISSIVLFYLGILFVYFVLFPVVFNFVVAVTPGTAVMMTDISQYLNFMLALFLVFGLAFEIPVATVLVVWIGLTTPQALAKKRPYILIGAFTLGMFLTPPDIISQVMLAIPMYALYEAGLFMSRHIGRRAEAPDAAGASMK